MRLGYLTYGLDRAPTGIGRYAVQLLKALAVLLDGPEIVLLTTEREDHHGLWARFERHALPGCHLLPGLLSVGNLALSRAVARLRLDLVHDPNGIAPFLGPSWGAGRVVTLHDTFAYVAPEAHDGFDTWRYRSLLPPAARRAAGVITVSQCSRRDLVRFLKLDPVRVHVTAEGVEACFRPLPDDQQRASVLQRYGIMRPYLLYVGGLNGRKNIPRLLEAYAHLRAQHPAVTLVIAGRRQWQAGAIDEAFRRLALEGRVHFTGYVADADLPALYSAAELFVFPSLYEGFGLPPLEAMACGTPVVTTNVSSLSEVVGDAALTVDPYDSSALAAALERALTDSALRAELRRKGLQRAAQFSWERTARETLAVYRQVLAARPARSRFATGPEQRDG